MKHCQACGEVIIGSNICPSCGNMHAEPSIHAPTEQPAKPPASNDTLYDSYNSFLTHTFYTFLAHPFVFTGLCFMALVPGFAARIMLYNAEAGRWIVLIINLACALPAQGAISGGVCEMRRGNDAEFSDSLARGVAHIGPLALGALLFFVVFVLEILLVTMEASAAADGFGLATALLAGSMGGILIIAMPVFLTLILMWNAQTLWFQSLEFARPYVHALPLSVSFLLAFLLALLLMYSFLKLISLWCQWILFVPVCVIERMGPIKSLKRSSELTKGFHFETFTLCMGYLALAYGVEVFYSIHAEMYFMIHPTAIFHFSDIPRLLVIAVPMALGNVMIALYYYKLRHVKGEAS